MRGVARTGTSPERAAIGRVVVGHRQIDLRGQSEMHGHVGTISRSRTGGQAAHRNWTAARARGLHVIDEAVVSRVLGAALQTGGDFAEVFVEDKRSSSAVLDDGKVEELGVGP
jgi:hypothetical protein